MSQGIPPLEDEMGQVIFPGMGRTASERYPEPSATPSTLCLSLPVQCQNKYTTQTALLALRRTKKHRASFRLNGKRFNGGYFLTKEEALEACARMREELMAYGVEGSYDISQDDDTGLEVEYEFDPVSGKGVRTTFVAEDDDDDDDDDGNGIEGVEDTD